MGAFPRGAYLAFLPIKREKQRALPLGALTLPDFQETPTPDLFLSHTTLLEHQ